LIEIGSKTAEKNSAQTNRQTDRHYENNGHLAVNQYTSYTSAQRKQAANNLGIYVKEKWMQKQNVFT